MKRLAVSLVTSLLLLVGLSPLADAALPSTIVECGETIEESILVANSIFGCDEHGLIINGSNLTLDLGGNFIAGNGSTMDDIPMVAEAGIRCVGVCTNVTIRNGSVSSFEVGIVIGATGSNVDLKEIQSTQNQTGFHISGAGTVMTGNVAALNTGDGFVTTFGGHTLTGNTSSDNGSNGFAITDGGNSIKSNRALDNSSDGFSVIGANNTLRSNQAHRNSTGFDVGNAGNKLSNNVATDSGFDGFNINTSNGTLKSDRAIGNGRDGFILGGSGNRATGVRANGNIEDGILMLGSNNALLRSRAIGNSDEGIEVMSGAGHTITKNVANQNGFLNGQAAVDNFGILVLGVTNLTASKNKAANNDGIAQCSVAANCS